jgi:hypothetical protein
MLATVGELPNGVLAMPRLLSNLSDAPMLGEAGILWQLSIQPEKGFPVKTGGGIPAYVYIVLLGVFLFGAWRIMESIETFREARRPPDPAIWAPRFQATAWACLVLGAVVALWTGHGLTGTVALVLGVMLPVMKRKRAPKGVEDWPDTKPSAPATPPQSGAMGR